MTRKERLQNTLEGKPVDRPAVNFYELNGYKDVYNQDSSNTDMFNIFSDPSWKPLLDLTTKYTDRIVNKPMPVKLSENCPLEAMTKTTEWIEDRSKFINSEIQIGSSIFKNRTRRDADIDTVWTLEHHLKNIDDVKKYLELPMPCYENTIEINDILKTEEDLGDSGIVMINMGDPLCRVAQLFDMQDYLMIAMTETKLFRQLLDRYAEILYNNVESVCKQLPGRLWRIVGAEYAAAPYMPTELFDEFVTPYDKAIVDIIHKYGGFARIHSHGNLNGILDSFVETGCMALDPIEPSPQGDVSLSYVRKNYGDKFVLFGNLEVSDIETLDSNTFEKIVRQSIKEGTEGEGKGFVLMPSACPYGRKLSDTALHNYEKIIEVVHDIYGA